MKRVYSYYQGFGKDDLIFSSLDNMRNYILSEIRKGIIKNEFEQTFWGRVCEIDSLKNNEKITYNSSVVVFEDRYEIFLVEKWSVSKFTHIEVIPKELFKGIKVIFYKHEEDHIQVGDPLKCSYCGKNAVGSFTESIPGGLFCAEVCEKCAKLVEKGEWEELNEQ